MFNIGIWSFSNHFKRKVFPSIKKNKKIRIEAILSKKKKDKDIELKNIKWFKNKKNFFKDNKFDYVYISSINSKHFLDCKYALERNVNVICEKPICLNIKQLKKLNKIAVNKRKKIFEMIQYIHHPLFTKLKKILSDKIIGKILKVKSSFKIPLSDSKNFRFKDKFGGGALYDVGFYPISIMFTLFNSKRVEILKSKLKEENKLDVNGNLISKNENGIKFDLDWGFKSLYKNYINIYGERGIIKIKFIFSKNILQDGKIIILKKKNKTINIKDANQINLAFEKMLFYKNKTFKNKLKLSYKILKIIEKIKELN